jgi:hypothetical protein
MHQGKQDHSIFASTTPRSFRWPPGREMDSSVPIPDLEKPKPKPTRRSAMRFSLAALTAGLTVPVVAALARSDLLATCDEFMRMEEYILRFDEGVLDVDEDTFSLVWKPHHALIDRITSIAAETHAERIAKAKAAFSVMRYSTDIESEAYDNLVRSALRDVIAGAVA